MDAPTHSPDVSQQSLMSLELTWLILLAQETGDEFWTFDLGTHELRIFYVNEVNVVRKRTIAGAPDAVIDEGNVHPSSLEAFHALYESILGGKERSSANVLLRNQSDLAYTWCTLAYRMQYASDGTPLRAVGVRRELEGLQESHRWFKSVPSCLYPHLLRASATNFTSHRVETMSLHAGGQTRLVKGVPLESVRQKTASSLFTKGDSQAYLSLVDLDTLERRYESGRRWSIGRFRTVEKGTVRPIRMAVNVRRDALGSLVALTYTSSCDQRSSWEAGADITVMRDAQTQLYQRSYAQIVARTVLEASAADGLAAVSVIHAFELGPVPHGTLLDLATAVGVFLDTDCVTYRYDDRSIGALFPSAESEDAVQRRLAAAVSAARESLVDASGDTSAHLSNIAIVAETVCASARRLKVTEAADAARRACDFHDPHKGDCISWPVSQGADEKNEGEDPSHSLYDITELEGEELRSFSVIAAAMLGTESLPQAINAALRGLGIHYQAQRVYLAKVTFDDDMLTIPFEWDDSGTTSIKGRLSNSLVSRFPFIEHNLGARRPVYVSRPRAFSHPSAPDALKDPWRFCTVPVSRTSDEALILCIDAPSRNLESWRLAMSVGARILHAWRLYSFDTHQSAALALGELGNMPGSKELDEIVARAGCGAWSSLGAIVVRIPDIAEQVKEHGLTHALEIYGNIKSTLEQLFDMMPAFHTEDTEFTALCPNSSYHAFIQKCAQARMALVSSYPRQVQLGSAWSDDSSGSWGVIDEARVIASHDTSSSFEEYPQAGNNRPTLESSLPDFNPFSRSAALSRRFTVYLQPKIDMKTGELVGAEALARLIGEDGHAGSPARAIGRMEESGEIGALDYFVFDYTLSLMSAWRQRGYDVPPVSSNFSRSTLLSPTALASVLAIMSRYPAVPSHLIEMEVTERAIDLGNSTLEELVTRYRALGLRVALDDFGSHYSSVSVLANVHFDTIKLDRSIVSGMPDNDVSRALIRNIAEICSSQNMECVAEGVESPEQAAALTKEGCRYCQGFYYDKPMPADLFERKYLVA